MVQQQLKPRGIKDERVLAAMAKVPREEFVSADQRRELDFLVDRCADAVEQLLTQGLSATQNQVH